VRLDVALNDKLWLISWPGCQIRVFVVKNKERKEEMERGGGK
jgi:hypothetical protein